ncbi:hypothetical protein AVEN_275339-1 [Araneus ventricosus]|uniref:Uncharacterized protein n=1 Tax=Araneus ventricosus TaxID=182803 RepID=A0A4Y2WJR2_ARAVE|nr:hypothetical protein AVEN_275339-1 [Araneus ventricosus]
MWGLYEPLYGVGFLAAASLVLRMALYRVCMLGKCVFCYFDCLESAGPLLALILGGLLLSSLSCLPHDFVWSLQSGEVCVCLSVYVANLFKI